MPTLAPPPRDCKIGLIIFGSLTILLGVFCLLMIPLMLLGTMVKTAEQPAVEVNLILPAVAFYLLIGVANIWLGIGSILCRLWARSLLLLVSLYWLFAGLMGILSMLVFSSGMASALPPSGTSVPNGVMNLIMITTYSVLTVIYLVLPGTFAWFYSRPNTRLTCEYRDPRERWTDRCPTPILGLALLNGLTAIGLPLILFFFPVFPFFGFYLRGPAAMILVLAAAGIFGSCAWGLYRLKPAFWWLSVGSILFFGVSYLLTIWQRGLMEIYHHMELSAPTMNLLENSSMLQGRTPLLFALACFLPYLGLLLYCRKYLTMETPIKLAGESE